MEGFALGVWTMVGLLACMCLAVWLVERLKR